MALGFITNLYLSWEIIIALHLFKRVADDLGGSPMRIQVAQVIQSLFYMLITSTLYTEVNSGVIIAIPSI